MILQLLILAFLSVVALSEVALALTCLRRCHTGRMASYLLLLSAPLQVASAIWAKPFLLEFHTQSSYDAPTDGFEILFQMVVLTVGLVLISVFLGVCVVGSLLFGLRKDRRNSQESM